MKRKRDYRDAVRLKLKSLLVMTLLGLAAVVISAYCEAHPEIGLSEYMSSFYMGTGTGLAVAGIVFMIKFSRLLKDEKKQKERELAEYDERNLYLRDKTMVLSGYILIAALYAGMLVAGLWNEAVVQTLLVVLCGFLAIIFCVGFVLRKKY